MHQSDLNRARSALYSLPPDMPRPDWVRAGMGAHAAGLSRDDWLEWSAGAACFNAAQARTTWKSFKAGKGVGEATLFSMAKAGGWKDDGRAIPTATAPSRKASISVPTPRPDMAPGDVWARCIAGAGAHGYAQKKTLTGAPLEGLRVLPDSDPLRIAGERMAGALVVPAYSPDNGALQSLQFITTGETAARLKAAGKSSKLNLTGAPLEDSFFTVGEPVTGSVVYVTEGVGQAWACWQATGAAAVACLGWGRVGRVAAALRQRDPGAQLVLVPDVGKEQDAEKIARELGCAVAYMPAGEESNFDANDLAQRDGTDILAELLEGATAYAPEEEAPHPLALFAELSEEPKAPRWVVPGFIGHGVTVVAGAHGVGKTTTLLPLAMLAAGLPTAPEALRPLHWRHVIYIVEELAQAERIIAGLVRHGGLGIDWQTVRERLHIVEAKRLPPDYVAQVGAVYRKHFTRHIEGVELLPLVVVDTMAATLALDSENDNAEASRAMAALKQGFDGLPVWLVGHLAKGNLTRSDAQGLTLRGAGAFEADANQVLYLVKEGEGRFLVRGKTRFEARWPELAIESHHTETMGQSEFGGLEVVGLRWATLAPPEQSRKEAAVEAQEQARKDSVMELRQSVRDAVETAWALGNPLNREGVKAKVPRKRNDVTDTIENLLSERWLVEVQVPARERVNSRKSAFLVALTAAEHDAVGAGDSVPAAKLVIPASWRKELLEISIPSVPEKMHQKSKKIAKPDFEVCNSVRTHPSVPPRENDCGTDGMGMNSPIPSIRIHS